MFLTILEKNFNISLNCILNIEHIDFVLTEVGTSFCGLEKIYPRKNVETAEGRRFNISESVTECFWTKLVATTFFNFLFLYTGCLYIFFNKNHSKKKFSRAVKYDFKLVFFCSTYFTHTK